MIIGEDYNAVARNSHDYWHGLKFKPNGMGFSIRKTSVMGVRSSGLTFLRDVVARFATSRTNGAMVYEDAVFMRGINATEPRLCCDQFRPLTV